MSTVAGVATDGEGNEALPSSYGFVGEMIIIERAIASTFVTNKRGVSDERRVGPMSRRHTGSWGSKPDQE